MNIQEHVKAHEFQIILFKFVPMSSCVLLPRPTYMSYMFNLRANICWSWSWNTDLIPNDSDLTC